jgi:hypothetical protein
VQPINVSGPAISDTATADAADKDALPLAVPFPPLQRVGLFAAASVRALADFARLNAAARECVTQMGVRDKALPGALRADFARGADRAAVKCAWECEALADALLPNARQLGIDAAQVELLIAFRDVGNLPASWSLATPLAQWEDVALSAQGAVTEIDLGGRVNQLTGHVELTALPASLTCTLASNCRATSTCLSSRRL